MKKLVYIQNIKIFNNLSNNEEFPDNEKFDFKYIEKFQEKDILKKMLKNKEDGCIFIDEIGNVNFVYQYMRTWKFLNVNIIDLFFAEKYDKYKINPSNEREFRKDIFRDYVHNLDQKGRYIYKNIKKEEVIKKQIMFFSQDDWKNEIDIFCKRINFLNYKNFSLPNKGQYTLDLIKDISDGKNIPGVNRINVISSSENNESVYFESGNTLINIEVIEDEVIVDIISTSVDEIDSHYLNKGMYENIRNNFLNARTSQRKVKRRDIVISLIGTIIFIILTALTFTLVFDPKNVQQSFVVLFDKKTFTQPWLYLLWINFFINFFFSFIIMTFTFYISTGRKPNYNVLWTFFIAAQIKATTRFITGEEIIGTIIWIWYLNRNSTIRTSALAGAVATLSIIRIPLTIILVSPFMIIGQVYASQIFNDLSNTDFNNLNAINTSLFYFLSWGGFVWGVVHHSIIPIVILLPPAHIAFNAINTRVEIRRNNNGIVNRLTNREMSILSMKKSAKSIFDRKDRIYRIALTLVLLTFIEALEIMYIFKIVENYMFQESIMQFTEVKANYNNFLQLSGIRMMVRNVYAFPVINLMPGNGMLVIEFFMSNVNQTIFIAQHNYFEASASSNVQSIMSISNDFAEQTAFITRFFNVYLRRFISLVVTLWVVKKIIVRKAKRI